jgi:hypothetical protein
VNVDTGAFAALTGRLDDLEREVDELAGDHREVAVNVAALMVHSGMLGAIPDSRPARARRAARHLRAVDGSAS